MSSESNDFFHQIDFKSDSNNKPDKNYESDIRCCESSELNFKVKIENHKKVSSFLETYIVYTIQTKGDFRPYYVERRYNDFQWLFQRLSDRYPMAIVPPLPEKHNLTAIERFSGLFIEFRRNALDKFLQRLTDHTILSLDKEFWSFLTLLPSMFNEYKRDRPVQGKVEFLLSSIQTLSATVTGSPSSTSGFQDSNLIRLSDDSARSATIMESLLRVVKTTGEVWENLSKIYQDEELQKNRWQMLTRLGCQCKKTLDYLQWQLEPWVVESGLYWREVQKVARKRNEAEYKFLSTISKQTKNPDSIPNSVNPSQHCGQTANQLHDIVSKNNADLTSELDRWRDQRSKETKEWLKMFADLHIEHYKQTSSIWRHLVTNGFDAAAADLSVNDAI